MARVAIHHIADHLPTTYTQIGNEYIYGVYAEYYTTMFPNASSLSITFVGSLGSAMTYFVGMIAGVIADRWGYRTTGLIGSMLVAAGCVLASFATQVWHLYLTQGILFGIGSSLVYFPAVSAPTHWFPPHQRGLVVGISVSGVGVGGLFMAPLTQFMIERIGVAWALRVTGIVCFVLMGGACLLLREKRTKEVVDTEKKADERIEVQRKPKASLAVFKELNMICMLVTEFASSFGYLVPFYFLSGKPSQTFRIPSRAKFTKTSAHVLSPPFFLLLNRIYRRPRL